LLMTERAKAGVNFSSVFRSHFPHWYTTLWHDSSPTAQVTRLLFPVHCLHSWYRWMLNESCWQGFQFWAALLGMDGLSLGLIVSSSWPQLAGPSHITLRWESFYPTWKEPKLDLHL
jgi:hypothetical protein